MAVLIDDHARIGRLRADTADAERRRVTLVVDAGDKQAIPLDEVHAQFIIDGAKECDVGLGADREAALGIAFDIGLGAQTAAEQRQPRVARNIRLQRRQLESRQFHMGFDARHPAR